MADSAVIVSQDAVASTIDSFKQLDASGDKRSMNKLARRLGKEQPALLAYAAAAKQGHDDATGEAAVFYATLVWAMFERHAGRALPRLTTRNLEAAAAEVSEAHASIEGLAERPAAKRTAPQLVERQPHVYAKLTELIAEDVQEAAMTADTAAAIVPPTQAIVEAFDAALDGRRPGERIGPVVRDQPRIGRNEPCPCGSGAKYKRCCGG